MVKYILKLTMLTFCFFLFQTHWFLNETNAKVALNVGLVELDFYFIFVGGLFKVENEYIPNIIMAFD